MNPREASLLNAAAQLLGPSVGGTEENFARIAQQAVDRALFLERILAQQTGTPPGAAEVEATDLYRNVGAV